MRIRDAHAKNRLKTALGNWAASSDLLVHLQLRRHGLQKIAMLQWQLRTVVLRMEHTAEQLDYHKLGQEGIIVWRTRLKARQSRLMSRQVFCAFLQLMQLMISLHSRFR